MASDGPFLQKLSQFESCNIPSAGTMTRQNYKLTSGNGLKENDRKNILDSLCAALEVRFQDTKEGIIPATSIANFKIWPIQESELQG